MMNLQPMMNLTAEIEEETGTVIIQNKGTVIEIRPEGWNCFSDDPDVLHMISFEHGNGDNDPEIYVRKAERTIVFHDGNGTKMLTQVETDEEMQRAFDAVYNAFH